jgi:predicted LPLAT superfamily acyltransferase
MSSAPPQAWLRQPERSHTWALRAFFWLALRIGWRAARAFLYPITLYFLLSSVRSRAASREYLARALARQPEFIDQFRHYYTFAETILDRVFLLAGRREEFRITIHGEPLVRDLFEHQRGCILLGAHFGSFEILRAVGWQQPDLRLYFLMFEENAQKIRRALGEINPGVADFLIPLGRLETMLNVRDRVVDGGWVGCLADRCVSGDKVFMQPFLGRDAPFPLGPFRLARALRCPVLTMFGVYRGDRRYDVHFELLADGADGPSNGDVVQTWVARYAGRLERHCREAPYNWFNFYAFWNEGSA